MSTVEITHPPAPPVDVDQEPANRRPSLVPIVGYVPSAPEGQWLADRVFRRVLLEIIRTPLALLAVLYCVGWYAQSSVRAGASAIAGAENH